MEVKTSPTTERREEQFAEEDATLTGVAVGGKAVDVGAGNVAVGTLAAVCVGNVTASGPGAQADSVSKVTITEEKMAFFIYHSPISSIELKWR